MEILEIKLIDTSQERKVKVLFRYKEGVSSPEEVAGTTVTMRNSQDYVTEEGIDRAVNAAWEKLAASGRFKDGVFSDALARYKEENDLDFED